MKTSLIEKMHLFMESMIHELENNSKKGCVSEWIGIDRKIVDLEYHKAKLLLSIRERNFFAQREYIADCANILFSMGLELGLYDHRNETPNMESVLPKKIIEVRPLSNDFTESFLTPHPHGAD